ncbi:MAG: DegT/DnrJ/EryC1/StrS family aminotransferase [Bacteroidales bacterium]|jgi:dTDP-4-amino-4,6-dideoxygalactose transaminase|nr:DegT/DnrJ/EryC1/StrS family aminotransferase [Bacteroidales bacterium]
MNNNKILVTQPAMPSLHEFIPYLEKIWESKWLTNNGQFHQQLESELADYLGVKYVSLFANGTLALLTALQTLKISGEVITTPYSFVATTNALWWNNLKPVFVDIDPDYHNLDPEKIAAAITPNTTAIMPVHVYGNPANLERIQEIADIYGLKVIYDAAHAFGVNYKGTSVLNYGDLSILSFHATKVFNTFEGGAIISHDEKTKKRIDYLKNFGFVDEITVTAPGINSKMNELQAAFGLLQLKDLKTNIKKRKEIAVRYNQGLMNIKGITLFKEFPGTEDYNYAYYPIFIDENEYGKTRDELYNHLTENGIFGRRYFYPLISNFPIYSGLKSAAPDNLKVANMVSQEVICLPIYPELELENVDFIINLIR